MTRPSCRRSRSCSAATSTCCRACRRCCRPNGARSRYAQSTYSSRRATAWSCRRLTSCTVAQTLASLGEKHLQRWCCTEHWATATTLRRPSKPEDLPGGRHICCGMADPCIRSMRWCCASRPQTKRCDMFMLWYCKCSASDQCSVRVLCAVRSMYILLIQGDILLLHCTWRSVCCRSSRQH